MMEAQQLSQPAGVDLVTLVAFPHGGILSRIAHQQFRHVRFQQVVQPGRRGSFFKRDLQVSAQPIEKLRQFAERSLPFWNFPSSFAEERLSYGECLPSRFGHFDC
jgi:hypothetical protein